MIIIKILIYDEDMFTRATLESALRERLSGIYKFDKVGNPFVAVSRMNIFQPDLVIIDINAHLYNTEEFLNNLINKYKVPCIVTSPLSCKKQSIEAGADAFIVKAPKGAANDGYLNAIVSEIHRIIGRGRERNGIISPAVKSGKRENLNFINSILAKADAEPRKTRVSYEILDNQNKRKKSEPAIKWTTDDLKKEMPQRLTDAESDDLEELEKKGSLMGNTETLSKNINKIIEEMREKRMARKKKREMREAQSAELPDNVRIPVPAKRVELIAIGASTGGTEAINSILQKIGDNMPPIVIVQHIPMVFSNTFAERLNKECLQTVKEAQDGDILQRNHVYIAPGNYHVRVVRQNGVMQIKLSQEEKVNGHRPSVDVMFNSVAECLGASALGVILTGMGADGAKGLLNMRKRKSITLGQDEATCVIYGMPKAAQEIGAVTQQVPLESIATMITGIARF